MGNFPDTEIRCPPPPTIRFPGVVLKLERSSSTFANWAAGTGDLDGSGWVPHALAEKRRAPAYGVLRDKCGRAGRQADALRLASDGNSQAK